MAYTFPDNYDGASCYLVPINASLIPLVVGALELFQHHYAWKSDTDYERGYNAFADLKGCMMRLCVEQLVESNNRLYRLLDGGLFGRQYTVMATEPELVISPAIPLVPDLAEIAELPGLLARLERLEHLVDNAYNGQEYAPDFTIAIGMRERLQRLEEITDNAMNGTVYTDYADTPGIRAELQLLVDNVGHEDGSNMIDELILIAEVLA